MLTHYLRKRVSVVTSDGRNLIGVLHSADQLMNIVLTSCTERVLAAPDATDDEAAAARIEESSIGVILLRGVDVVSVGVIDVYEEAGAVMADWSGRDMPAALVVPRASAVSFMN